MLNSFIARGILAIVGVILGGMTLDILRATAQAESPATAQILEGLPPDIQEKLKAEATRAGNSCRSHHTFRVYQDCNCIEMKFLDARLGMSPHTSDNLDFSTVFNSVSLACPNKPAIENYENRQCVTRTKIIYPSADEGDITEFCKCVAEKVSSAYVAKPGNSSHYQSRLGRDAQLDCGSARFMIQERSAIRP